MQLDPWEVPDRAQVLRWRQGHQYLICGLGGVAVGHLASSLWLAVPLLAAWGVMVVLAHDRLDRRYDSMREVHDHAA